jgi:ABC-type histidine transport system ATPase subunit
MAGIRIDSVTKTYGGLTVLKAFSLDIADGEFVDPRRPLRLRQVDPPEA